MAIYFDSIGNTITNPKKRFSPYSFHAKLDEMTIEEVVEVRAEPVAGVVRVEEVEEPLE